MAEYPYYSEPTHDRGTVTIDANNAARTTATSGSSGEDRLVVDILDKIMLLEPNKHPLVTLLTQVGKVWDGQAWKGVPIRKSSAFNPEFKWIFPFFMPKLAIFGPL